LSPLIIGRIFVGYGAGLGICVGPIYLSEITPSNKGTVGVLTQLGIVLGIFLTQAIGLRLATPHQWRIVPMVAGLLSTAQVLCTPLIAESPEWLHRLGRREAQKVAERRLWRVQLGRICGFIDA
jgi:MFS family permease